MLPVVDKQQNKYVMADGFHNAKYVCIFNSENETYNWLEADEISNKPGGFTSGLTDRGISSVICQNISPMLLTMFRRSDIKVWKANNDNLAKNLRLFQLHKLNTFSAEECRIAQTCDSHSCSSCGSSCK